MIQKNYAVRGFDELKEKLPEIQGAFCACNYQDGVINVYIASIPEDEVKKILDLLKESFPKLKIIGMSGISLEMFHDTSAEPQVRIDFVLMESAGVTLFSKEFSRDSDNLVDAAVEYAKDLNRQIRDMKNVKCIEIYFAWIKASASIILTELSKGLEKVPIFGAVANENDVKRGANYFRSDNRDSIVVSDNWFGPGVSVAVYSGEDLYVYADCLFGWKPMGKYLDVHAQPS